MLKSEYIQMLKCSIYLFIALVNLILVSRAPPNCSEFSGLFDFTTYSLSRHLISGYFSMFYTILNEEKKTENMKSIHPITMLRLVYLSIRNLLMSGLPHLPVHGTSLYTREEASPHTTHNHIIIETFPFDKS